MNDGYNVPCDGCLCGHRPCTCPPTTIVDVSALEPRHRLLVAKSITRNHNFVSVQLGVSVRPGLQAGLGILIPPDSRSTS